MNKAEAELFQALSLSLVALSSYMTYKANATQAPAPRLNTRAIAEQRKMTLAHIRSNLSKGLELAADLELMEG